MNAEPRPDRASATVVRASRRDRLIATAVSGPLGRGVSFFLELGAAIARGLRGERRDPEERRYER